MSLASQTDKLGQPVAVGCTVVASYMHGRSHRFVRDRVDAMTPQFAVLSSERRVRFYNTVVIDKLMPTEKAGLLRTYELADV